MLRKEPFSPNRDGSIAINLDDDQRGLLRHLFGELRDILMLDDDDGLRRLYPTAYPNDVERDAGYQALVHGELMEKRLEALDEVEATVDNKDLTPEQLGLWMTSINELRLILGTKLDVSEEDTEIDPEAPDAQPRLIYMHLGWLLEQIVAAATQSL